MNPNEIPRRPSRLAKLKTLPEDKQAQIITWLKSPAGGPGTVDLILANYAIQTSDTALSEFWSWWHLQRRFAQNSARVESVLEYLHTNQPQIPEDSLFQMGQTMFSALAIDQEDAATWTRVQKLNLNKAQIQLEARRIAMLEAKTKALEAVEETSKKFTLDPAAKAELLAAIDKKLLGE